jgi:hypothetical protein
MNVMPGDEAGQWKVTVALPSPITSHQPNGQVDLRIELGHQKFAGVWDENTRSFKSVNASYQNTRMLVPDGGIEIAIPRTTMTFSLQNGSHGNMWSGPAKFLAEQISMTVGGAPLMTIGKLSSEVSVIDYNAAEVNSFNEKISALTESYNSGDSSNSGEHFVGMYNLLSGSLGSLWDGLTMQMRLQDLQTKINAKDSVKTIQFKLADAGFGLGLTGFRNNNVSLKVNGHYRDLYMNPVPPDVRDSTPTDMNIDVSINKIPFQELFGLGGEAVKSISARPNMIGMAGISFIMKAPQVLTQAGTNLALKDTFLSNDVYNVMLNAMLTANLNAVMGAEGKGKVEIFGLKKLIEIMERKSISSDTQNMINNKSAQIKELLMALQKVGERAQNQSGQPVHTFDLKLTEQGEALINDESLSNLMTSIAPPQ